MLNVKNILNGKTTVAVVDNQFGDTGKGKIVDLFAQDWAQIIARGTGGANAGHTIVANGKKIVLHLIPSGILHDGPDKVNIIGRGVAFDPALAIAEIQALREANVPCNHLRISHRAPLVLPQHVALDRLQESLAGAGKIGTTGRGIGPAYVDHYARVGLTVNDLLNVDELARKLRANLKDKVRWLKQLDPEQVRLVLHQPDLGSGMFYCPKDVLAIDAIAGRYACYGSTLKPMICDTDQMLDQAVGRKRILLEGAQGLLISVNHGTYPYVTSSDSSVHGLAAGVGLSSKNIDLTLGLNKGFYMTRVGEGPFPTELGDQSLTVGIRERGGEFGATTGRPRRIGWLDLPMLRYARQINGPDIMLTKIDVLDDQPVIRICDSYRYRGPRYQIGDATLQPGSHLTIACSDSSVLAHCQPIYQSFPGWRSDTSNIRAYDQLPEHLRRLIEFVEKVAAVRVQLISVGSDREQTIIKD